MSQARLKLIRVILALLFILLTAFIFLDFREHLPSSWINGITWIQFIPSLLKFLTAAGLLAGGFMLVLLLTALFGRVYCSAFCPLGIFQDMISWFRRKTRKKHRFRYGKPQDFLRYGFLVLPLLVLIAGGSLLGINLLDPYSIFGRIVSDLFRPLYTWSNNGLARLFESFEWYILYPQDVTPARALTYIFPGFMLGLVLILSFLKGRMYCNTVCPVGTLLGLISRISVFRIRMLEEACTKCGKCAVVCKASCIRVKTLEVDFSRCVGCFNCLQTCPEDAIRYQPALLPAKQPVRPEPIEPPGQIPIGNPERVAPDRTGTFDATGDASHAPPEPGRRKAIGSMLAAGLMLRGATGRLSAQETVIENKIPTTIEPEKHHPVSPPGSLGLRHFTNRCTACHLCVSACPTGVLQPSLTEYGWAGIMQPHMDFVSNYCNYDCVRCTEVCPTGAILSLTGEAKKSVQIGNVKLILENCIPYVENTACGSCSEHCPTQAVTMVPHIGDLTIPEIRPEICVGCGACEHACPTTPFKAIYVDGHEIHEIAQQPEVEELEKTEMEDFPF